MKKRSTRVFSLLLVLITVANLIATAVFPAVAVDSTEGTTESTQGGVVLSKSAVLTDDGTYTIDLSAFVTGETVNNQITTATPLDIVLVLDASSSMTKFTNSPDTYEVTADVIPGWEETIKNYPSTATVTTNLFDEMSFRARFYSYDAQGWSSEAGRPSTGYPIRGSILIPVKPGDKIYCSSFKTAAVTGGSQDGICVAYFKSDGTLVSSVSAEAVSTEFNNSGYVTVPDNAYLMNIPLWNNDADKVVYNLSLGEERFNPTNEKEFAKMRAKILQAQLQSFVDSLAANSKEIGMQHKLAIVTFGGSVASSAPGYQGRYESFVGVNGFNDNFNASTHQGTYTDPTDFKYHTGAAGISGNSFYSTNSGLFTGGTFKNYFRDNYTNAGGYYNRYSYTAVYSEDLDTSKVYYYFMPTNDVPDDTKGYVRAVKYDATLNAWVNQYGSKVTPQAKPYGSLNRIQFYERQIEQFDEITTAEYKNALTDVLVTGAADATLATNPGSFGINPDIQFAVDHYFARGNTFTSIGMAMADKILEENPQRTVTDPSGNQVESQQLVILFTDGNTNDKDTVSETDPDTGAVTERNTYQSIFYRGNRIKNRGAKIYTISVADNENGDTIELAKWLDQLSSNHDNLKLTSTGEACGHDPAASIFDSSKALSGGKYSKNIDNADALSEIFTTITTDITTPQTSVSLDSSAVMQDYLNNGLILPGDFSFYNIKISTYGIQTTDGINYTTTNQDGIFTLVEDSVTEIETEGVVTGGTATYRCVYTLNGETITKDLYATYDRITGRISVTNFDYALNFVTINHPGRKLVVQVTGVEATSAMQTDILLATNGSQSGVAYTPESGQDVLYPFDVPQTQIASRTYVMDYAKPATISSTDFGASILGIAATSRLNITKYSDGVDAGYGSVEDGEGIFTFTPTTMQWGEAAVFYVLCTLTNEPSGVTTGANQWVKVSVVPANNIYYEDDFSDISYTQTDAANNITSGWTAVTSTENSTENFEGMVGDAEGIHGWEGNLVDKQYSDGSTHSANISNGKKAEATFTFTGMGVDIYSLTNATTGTVVATLRGGEFHEEYGGYYEVSKTQIVDTQSVSGAYYQIPTVSFMNLPYDTYTVTIYVTNTAKDRFEYHLDGIRVYNPLQDDTVYDVAEQNASFTEIRDLLSTTVSDKKSTVFIDKTEDGLVGAAKDYSASEYGLYGPKNEVYLTTGQSITFKVDAVANGYYYIGLKCPDGSANANVKVSNGNETTREISVAHSTDLYYNVIPDANGYITIENNGTGLLSVTKLRIAGSAENAQVLAITEDEAISAVKSFSLRRVMSDAEVPGDTGNPPTSDVNLCVLIFVMTVSVIALLCCLGGVHEKKIH